MRFPLPSPLHLVVGLSLSTSAIAGNLAINGSFVSDTDWKLISRNGAEGSISRVSPGYSDDSALQITSKTGEGYLVLRSERPIRVKAGVTYTFRGRYRAENAPVGALLLFRVGSITSPLNYDSIDRSAGWSSQSLVVNTPPGRWEQRTITFKSTQTQDVYLNLVVLGAAFDVQVDQLEFEEGVVPAPQGVHQKYSLPFSKEEVLAKLEERQPTTAQLIRKGTGTQLQIDHQPAIPVIYKGLESTLERGDFEAFGKAGVPLAITAVRLGPSSLYPDAIWRGAGEYDLEKLDAILLAVLQKNPDARIILDIWAYPYPKWGDENPTEVMRKPSGEVVLTTAFNHKGVAPADASAFFNPKNGKHAYPSIYSKKWRDDVAHSLSVISAHLKTSPYGKAVAGFFVTTGQDGQFVYTGTDASDAGKAAFHQWLQKRYGTIAALNTALKTDYKTFDSIALPDYDELPAAKRANLPLYIGGIRPLYGEFKEESAWAFRDEMAGLLKQAMDRPVLVLAYATPVSRHLYTSRYLDGTGTMTYYPFRNPGHAIGFNPGNGAERHGKLIFQEIDLRSWTGSRYGEVYQRWIGAGDTPERWQAINRHLAGISLANHFGYWYYDMGNYYQAPEITSEIAETVKVASKLAQQESSDFQPGVVVVSSDVGDSHMANRYMSSVYSNLTTLHQMILVAQGWTLNTSGVPYHVHTLQDILSDPELRKYKVYIFYQSPYLSQEERVGIRENLARDGRTLIWMHDAGYLTDSGPSIEAQSELVGMKLHTDPIATRSIVTLTADPHPLTRGVRPQQNLTETLASIFSLRGAGEFGAAYQLFSIADPQATVLGRYPESGEAAFAVKKMDDWTSIFLGAPNSLGNDLLHRIAQESGAFVAGPPGESIVMNGNFASIHALSNRRYPLTLPPGKLTLKDALTGEIISEGKPVVELSLTAQHTYWYLFEK